MKKLAAIAFLILILCAVLYLNSNNIRRLFYPLEFKALILKISKLNSVESSLIAAVIYEESRFQSNAKSKAGAVGLMQIMPATADWISKKIKAGSVNEAELMKPTINIRYGTWYLSFLRKRYGRDDLALAAYNGGFQNVDKWLTQSLAKGKSVEEIEITFGETREFIKRVKATQKIYKELYKDELN